LDRSAVAMLRISNGIGLESLTDPLDLRFPGYYSKPDLHHGT